MATKGFLQATIAYKVSEPDERPLDINDQYTSVSGRKQAVFLLVGTANPSPSLYEVQGYFYAEGLVDGVPTTIYSPEDCPTGFIKIVPDHLYLITGGAGQTAIISSSGPWVFASSPPLVANISLYEGPTGDTAVTFTPVSASGQGAFIFMNTLSGEYAQVYVISAPSFAWILTTGFWNNLGLWEADGVWNY